MTELYVSILKWKAGEQRALRQLSYKIKDTLSPLVELVGNDQDDGPTTSISEHLTHATARMAEDWGTSSPLLVDVRHLRPAPDLPEGPLAYVLEAARTRAVQAVPVISCASSPEDVRAARAGHAQDGRGICLREGVGSTRDKQFPGKVDQLLRALRVELSSMDFVLDLGHVAGGDHDMTCYTAEGLLKGLPHVHDWRSLVLAAGGFPVNLAGLPPGVHELPRTEWNVWNTVTDVPRRPSFGDYSIAHPELSQLDMRMIKPSANIRYTTPTSTLIVRGRVAADYRHGGFGQFHSLSRTLTQHPEYQGPLFSWGDGFIKRCAGGDRPGNLTTWRQVGTNHHLTMVVTQLASRSGTGARS